jgi:hypothetical protein
MMAQLQTFQQGQSANQLNQMKIAEAQRGMEEANALRRLDPSSASYLQDVMRVSPEKGFAFAKSQQEAKAAGTESQIKNVKLLTDTLATIPEMYKRANTPEDFLAIHQSVHSNPVLGPWLKSIGATPDKGLATLQTAAQTPGGLEQYRQQAMSSVAQILESAKPIIVSPSASVYSGGKFTQAPAAPVTPKQTDLQLNYQAAKDQGFVGSIFDYEKKLKEAGRAPATPATPSAPVAVIDPVTGKPVYVSRDKSMGMTPASAKVADLKQVPVHAQKAIVGASTAISKIDDAIAALKGGTEEATGMKGYLPDMALNRMYPKGTEARAAVADIGSLVMHERSGAAVTASESPRLKPFIPLITDDKTTALKKLKRMRQIQADDAEALAGTYTPEQGFREFKTPNGKTAAPAAAGGATGGWGKAEAESK